MQNEAPETFARIEAFYESKGGTDILSKLSGVKSPMMSYGIAKLLELVEQTSPTGPAAAERAFAAHYDAWSQFGSAPDAAFLRRFAELCLEAAGAASASDVRHKGRSK